MIAQRQASSLNLLDMYPERQLGCAWEDDETLSVLVPKFSGPVLGRLLQPRLRKPNIRVHLDELGTAVWQRSDGQTEVRAIAAALAERFGAELDPGSSRLAAFLCTMERRGYLRLLQEPAIGQAPAVPARDEQPDEGAP